MAGTSFYLTSIQLLVSLAIAIIVKSVSSAPVSLVSSGSINTNSVSSMAKIIAEEAGELYEQLCATPNLCGSSMERSLKVELKLPEITDKCLSKEFNKEQCLHEIHRDLLRFETYFKFLKETLKSEGEKLASIQRQTKTLAEAVKKMENNPNEEEVDTNTSISVEDLHSKDAWNEKLTTYLILQSFKDYMIKTTRAIRNSSI
ncbi:interleukin-6 [Pyxicephalus adspersus]|uniref:interleukin-6 n=1 Tax=Pyxicephalus adspersus TaxID=30357 RepID=UPI003B5B4957